jgi:hypothetical protein
MIDNRNFPADKGITFTAEITENTDGTTTAKAFDFALNGKNYSMPDTTFTLDTGDTVYITPNGLKKYAKDSYPGAADLFPNNAAYWLISRIDSKKIIVLEAR